MNKNKYPLRFIESLKRSSLRQSMIIERPIERIERLDVEIDRPMEIGRPMEIDRRMEILVERPIERFLEVERNDDMDTSFKKISLEDSYDTSFEEEIEPKKQTALKMNLKLFNHQQLRMHVFDDHPIIRKIVNIPVAEQHIDDYLPLMIHLYTDDINLEFIYAD